MQLFTQGCTDKGPPLKSQGLYFYSGGGRGVNVSRLPTSSVASRTFCELSPASRLFSTNLAMLLLLSRLD